MTSAAPEIWGIVNVTPDSFSDGGAHFAHADAIAHGRRMRAEGATVLDVGGESTRPGSMPVGADEEQRRVLPVIEALAAEGAVVSVDTYRADVAEAALAAGARIVNDVSGGLEDPRIFEVVAAHGAEIAIGHWRGPSADMYAMAQYASVADEVAGELTTRVEAALTAGVPREKIILDPGIGFAKDAAQSWAALRSLDVVLSLGHRVLVGASRKRFLQSALGEGASTERRDLATAVTSVLSARAGAYGVRVHDVQATADALAVARAWQGDDVASAGVHGASAATAHDAGDDTKPGEIELTGLRVFGRHGVFDFERENGQEFVVDLALRLPFGPAAASDDVADTVHYGELAEVVAGIVGGDPVDLIETLADRIADTVLAHDARIERVAVTVHKPSAPIPLTFQDVSVRVVRERSPR